MIWSMEGRDGWAAFGLSLMSILKSPQITRCWQCWEWYILFNTLFSWGMGTAGDLYTTTIVSVLLISNCAAISSKRFVCNTQTQAHGWLDGRTNAWNDNNTHRHQCWPRVSHLETSAFLTLCHSFPVTCQQMCKNLKMWLTDLLTDKQTDRRTDKRVAGGTIAGGYCYGPLNLV